MAQKEHLFQHRIDAIILIGVGAHPGAVIEVVAVGICGVGVKLAEGEFDGIAEFPAVGGQVIFEDVGAAVGAVAAGEAEDQVAVGVEDRRSPVAIHL
jgi:hypothetical protein